MDIQIPQDAINKYIERRFQDLDGCRKAIASGDYSFIERVGHQIKGNALTFGFDELAPIGADMESFAGEKNIKEIMTAVDKFENYLKNLSPSPNNSAKP